MEFEFERSAMSGEPMPDGLKLAEQCAWQALAHLYARYRMKLITREQGHKEKGYIAYQLSMRLEQDEFNSSLSRWTATLMKSIEGASCAYQKKRKKMGSLDGLDEQTRTALESADALVQVIYGLKRDFKEDKKEEE